MGGGGKGGGDTNNQAADDALRSQTDLAERIVSQTDPLREQLVGQSNDFLSGGFDVSGLPQYAAGKDTIEDQFGRGQDSIIAATPEGGGLTSALADLEGNRAGSLVGLEGQLSEAETNRALQLGTFGAAQGTAGLGQAGATSAQLALAESSANAGKSAGLGQAGGRIGSSVIDGK